MSLFIYNGKQKSPPNYIGIRVSVMINGKHHQKWYAQRGLSDEQKAKQLEEAQQLEMKWLMEKNINKSIVEGQRKTINHSIYDTPVKGIKMKFLKRTSQKNGKKYISFTPVFNVEGSYQKQRFHKAFNMKVHGFELAWFKACDYLGQQYGINSVDKFIAKKPSVEQMIVLLVQQRKLGCSIATNRLPNELLEQFKTTDCENAKQIYQSLLTDKEKAKIKQKTKAVVS